MKATVTFACDCQQSHVEALIERATDGAEAARLLFQQTGRQSVALAGGAYDVAYRAQGTPHTTVSLKVVEGGSMRVIERLMPPDGQAAGVRRLLVVVRLALIPLCLVRGASVASAQSPSALRQRAEQLLSTLPNVSDVLQPGYYLTVEAGLDSRAATGTIAGENGAGSFSGSLSLTGPLDSASATKLPRKLDGLPNSGTVKLALHWFYWPERPDLAAMMRVCEQALQRTDCDEDELADAADRARFVRLAHSGDAPIVATAHASFGRKSFRYLEPATLASNSEAHLNWSAGFGLGRFTPTLGYVAVEFEGHEHFDAGETTDLCDLVGATELRCRTAVMGEPTRSRLAIGGIEWRVFISGGRLALNPSLSHDFRSGVSSVDVPFYVLALSSSGLNGGARASWRSDTNDLAVALFVGAALRPTP